MAAQGPTSTAKPARSAPNLRVALALGLAAAVTVAAGLGAWVQAYPLGGLASGAPLAFIHDARAAAYMRAAINSEDLDRVEREARLALAQSPASAGAWVRLAIADVWRHRRLTPLAINRLQRSYEVSPLGPDVSPARVKLALEAWPSLPPVLREAALTELEAIWARDAGRARALVGEVAEAQGRLVGGMALADVEARAALRASQ